MRGRLAIAGLVVCLVGVAACSDDGGSSETTDEAPELTGPPIKVMVTGTFDAFGADYSQIPDAAQAAADAVAAAGGVNGSPVELIVCNQENENDAADCARQAVDEDVVATVGTFSQFSPSMLPILEEAGIPQVAPYLIDFADYTSAINFPVMGGLLTTTAGMGAQLADAGAETINVSYLDIEQAALGVDLLEIGSDPRGASVVSETPVPSGTTDFSPQAASATTDDPAGIAILLGTDDTPGFLRALRQTGYEGDLATSTSSVTSAQLEELGDEAEGLLLPSNFKPPTLTDDPAVQQYNDELEQYAPGTVADDTSQNSWLGIHLLADVLAGVQGKINAATVTDALENAGTVQLGLTPPLDFAQGTEVPALAPGLELRVFNTSVVYTTVEDGQLVATTGKFVDVLEG
jgi:ABC-type branched-subunit amino acid transport system substrate-binding protein